MALRLIDDEGLEAVTVRRLAKELNVKAVSFYHHFEDKDEILAGACRLAFEGVRTPKTADQDWKAWLLEANIIYFRILQAHPNLIPILMGRFPLRIVGMSERNATAGLLALQGVPPGYVLPLIDALEEIALGAASFIPIADDNKLTQEWQNDYPFLYLLGKQRKLSKEKVFTMIAKATIDTFVREFEADPTARADLPTRADQALPASDQN